MLERAYIEITDVCNLSCSFCPKTERPAYFMPLEAFLLYARQLRAYTDVFCLHVMGEPLLHPELDSILSACDLLKARVILTTNGTLLERRAGTLLSHDCVYKIQISLHSGEANGTQDGLYYERCIDFARASSQKGIVTILRLWNRDGRVKGENAGNEALLEKMKASLGGFWKRNQRGYCISPKLYLEYDERFVWPDASGARIRENGFCRAVRTQIAVLCDGTVTPCCLDRNGEMRLGDLKTTELYEILSSKRAQEMASGFARGVFTEDFCRTCGYADRFQK